MNGLFNLYLTRLKNKRIYLILSKEEKIMDQQKDHFKKYLNIKTMTIAKREKQHTETKKKDN